MEDDIPLTKQSVTVQSKEVSENDWNEQTLFPFQDHRERHQVRIDQHAASFPTLGIGALVGALTLVIVSGVVLLVIQGPAKIVSDWTVPIYNTDQYLTIPKPAAWLSGLLSAISVCLHIALSEGLNIAWWYHARLENATLRDLYEIWGHGTSTWAVVQSGAQDLRDGIVNLGRRATRRGARAQPYRQQKRFSYVALATLFAATIPLNGFLLQSAVIVVLEPATKKGDITVPMLTGENFINVQQVQATADLYGSGGVRDWSKMLGKLSQVVTPKVAAIVDLGSFNTTCADSCKTNVKGMGFDIQCEDSVQSYDIPPVNATKNSTALQSMFTHGRNVVDVAVTFNAYNRSLGNTVTLRSLWKNKPTCKGDFSVQVCNMSLATVEYPVVINSKVQQATRHGLQNITTMTLDLDLRKESPKVVSLPPNQYVYTEDDGGYPVVGLAGLFAQTLNSSINLSYSGAEYYGTTYNAQGLFGHQRLAESFNLVNEYLSCEDTIGNVTQEALAIVQSMMFQLGAYNWLTSFGDPRNGVNIGSVPNGVSDAEYVSNNTPRPMAVQSYQRNEYKVVWAWYFGAMAVTLIVSLAILPTFWGYWRLERKTTMSPFETARAFRAPVLFQQDATIKSEDLIKKVGDVNIHRDLPVVPMRSPGPERASQTW